MISVMPDSAVLVLLQDKPHPYRFTVWALKTDKLPIDSQSSGALVGFMLNTNALAHAEITPHYGR